MTPQLAKETMKNPSLKEFFTEHLHEAHESYFQHLNFCLYAFSYLFVTAVIILIHGLLPFTFTHTGSSRIERFYFNIKARVQKQHS